MLLKERIVRTRLSQFIFVCSTSAFIEVQLITFISDISGFHLPLVYPQLINETNI